MKRKNRGFVKRKLTVLVLPFALLFFTCLSFAQTSLAPGAPGRDAQWATAGKQGVGTSNTLASKVWFTLAQGVMTEVYYPDVTQANVHLLQFVVVNPKTRKVETEQEDAVHQIKVLRPDSLTFRQINTAKSGAWTITKTYATNPDGNAVWISVQFQTKSKDLQLYVYYDPSLKNSGMHDTAFNGKTKKGAAANVSTGNKGEIDINQGPLLVASDDDVTSVLSFDVETADETSGFSGVSDGLAQLREKGSLQKVYERAEKGNVVQMARIVKPQDFVAVLSFGKDLSEALNQITPKQSAFSFSRILNEYEKGWSDYVKTLRQVAPVYQAQFNMAAMILRAHEDKTHRGANIASLSIPWGGGETANENTVAGYHLVWSRDLYQVATAFMALGDREAALRALDFLFRVQQKPDGSFPQNSFLDGKPFWGSLQLDEVAYPLILAYQLGRSDQATYENHVKKAADFIVRNGPRTPQERWEEEAGYSPSTIAAEIAGLVCAAEIAAKNGDEASAAIYLAAADDWARKIEMWTATTSGKYGDGNYYLRITQNGRPDAGERIELNNGAGFFDEREIVDAGFLELVRLGIKPADDPLIAKSVKVIDQVIKVKTPNGDAFYRYNHDGYGEMDDGRRWNFDGKYTGKGRLWALLSGERGQYELAIHALGQERQGDKPFPRGYMDWELKGKFAALRLDQMRAFANEGLMLPEQIWDKKDVPKSVDRQFVPELRFGEGTGSATPLAWSMAQFIRLAVNLQEGRNLETPDIVYERYAKKGIPGQASNFGGLDEEFYLPYKAGETVRVPRRAPAKTKVVYTLDGETRVSQANEKGELVLEFKMPAKDTVGLVGVVTPGGATAFERVMVLANPREPQFSAAVIDKIKAAKQSPLVENGKAILFYRGAAESVRVAGDITNWNPGKISMRKIADRLWAAEIDLASAARVEYKIVVDGKWIDDPLNPNSLDNGVGGRNNFFAMPGYQAAVWEKGEPDKEVFLNQMDFRSSVYNGTRLISVYVPKECAAVACPVLYLQDGGAYAQTAKAVQIQQSLVKTGKVKPFLMVFLNPKDRTKEYWASDEYAKFVAEEVVPAIDKEYKTIKTREGRAILGASLGGITSVWVGLKYPDLFGRIGGQSSSFWVDDERVVRELEKLDPRETNFRFYFDDGAFEGTEDTRRVNVLLRGKGYPVTYREGVAGHNWTSWRDRLAEAFVALWK